MKKYEFRILMYHRIEESEVEDIHSVNSNQFYSQLSWLKDEGYQTVNLHDIHFRNDLIFKNKTVAITFDDGYEDFYYNAFPMLNNFGFTATVYLVTGYMGQNAIWLNSNKNKDVRLLNWCQVNETLKHGIAFGAHTDHHVKLDTLTYQATFEEVKSSKEKFQNEILLTPRTFSFPFSSENKYIFKILKELEFWNSCTYIPGLLSGSGFDLFRLKRIGILASDNLISFKRKLESRNYFFFSLKYQIRKLYKNFYKRAKWNHM